VAYDMYGGEYKRCRILVCKPEGKRQFGRPWPKSEDNVKWILQKHDEKSWTKFVWLTKRTMYYLL
jgi:hypothetical protein